MDAAVSFSFRHCSTRNTRQTWYNKRYRYNFFWNRLMDALLNVLLIYVNTRECLYILRVIRTSFYILTSFNPNQTIIIQTIVGSTSVRILKCFRFGRDIKTSWHEENFRYFNFPLQFNCVVFSTVSFNFHHNKSIFW